MTIVTHQTRANAQFCAMSTPEIFGLFLAVFVGISLGLTGGGGAIFTVPIFVYLYNVSPVVATGYSLFVVGTTSLVGTLISLRKKNVNFAKGLYMGLSSIITVFLIRTFVMPVIPENIFLGNDRSISLSKLTMLVFACLMILISATMIRNTKPGANGDRTGILYLFFPGILVGIVTGFLGAGGGFMLIPALILVAGLPVREAVGTSLFIITLNSLVGFLGDITHRTIDWNLVLPFSGLAILGLVAGQNLNQSIKPETIKKIFGFLVLITGIVILWSEIWQ